MNGLEALNTICKYCDKISEKNTCLIDGIKCKEYKAIENDLNVLKIITDDMDSIDHYIDENGVRTISFGQDHFLWQEDWDKENFNKVWEYMEREYPLKGE